MGGGEWEADQDHGDDEADCETDWFGDSRVVVFFVDVRCGDYGHAEEGYTQADAVEPREVWVSLNFDVAQVRGVGFWDMVGVEVDVR